MRVSDKDDRPHSRGPSDQSAMGLVAVHFEMMSSRT